MVRSWDSESGLNLILTSANDYEILADDTQPLTSPQM